LRLTRDCRGAFAGPVILPALDGTATTARGSLIVSFLGAMILLFAVRRLTFRRAGRKSRA